MFWCLNFCLFNWDSIWFILFYHCKLTAQWKSCSIQHYPIYLLCYFMLNAYAFLIFYRRVFCFLIICLDSVYIWPVLFNIGPSLFFASFYMHMTDYYLFKIQFRCCFVLFASFVLFFNRLHSRLGRHCRCQTLQKKTCLH